MEIPFLEPGEIPVPPDQVRLRSLMAEPYPDRNRVRVQLTLTPFLERPTIEIVLQDPHGSDSGSVTVVESTDSSLSMTLHLRSDPQPGEYRAIATIVYPDRGAIHSVEAAFVLPPVSTEDAS